MKEHKKGLLLVFIAYFTWGLLPGYWKMLSTVQAAEVLSHRIIWSVVFLGLILLLNRKLVSTLKKLTNLKLMAPLALSSGLITVNWLIYVWAIGKGYFIEAGLGYYICPLLTMALSTLILKEKLDRIKLTALSLTALGVVWKIAATGTLPFVALGLGVSFAFYTLLRKKNPIDPIEGLFLETILVFIPALLFFGFLVAKGESAVLLNDNYINALLVASGVITAVPLLILASGAPKVSLQTTSLFQFITPTMATVVGLMNGDSIGATQMPAFILIWSGILVYLLPMLKDALGKVNSKSLVLPIENFKIVKETI